MQAGEAQAAAPTARPLSEKSAAASAAVKPGCWRAGCGGCIFLQRLELNSLSGCSPLPAKGNWG